MIQFLFAAAAEHAEEAVAATEHAAEKTAEHASGLPLGIDVKTLVFQFITFLLVFIILRRFAVKPIVAMLDKRHKTIDDGVRMGLTMEKEKAKFDKNLDGVMRDARHDADKVIANANKEAREIMREAEKTAQRKADAMFADAEARIAEESRQATRKLEKDIVGMVSDATEAIVGEKVDASKDAKIIDKALKGQKS